MPICICFLLCILRKRKEKEKEKDKYKYKYPNEKKAHRKYGPKYATDDTTIIILIELIAIFVRVLAMPCG